jgi:putative DNA primase/helicase
MGRDEKLVRYLQRVIGYALTGAVSEKAIFFLYGSGNNGKTTFLEAIRHVMGDYASQIPIESLMSKANEGISNDIARLKGRRFVTSSEAEQGRKLAESKVKQLTGMGKIQARFLFQEYFEFDAEFKIFMDSNHKPEIRGTDEAIWSRIKLIPFAVSIPASDIDKQLSKKLRSEAAGILAWAVRGCLEWQAAGGLDEPEAVKAAVKGYREEMDTAAEFLEEHCLFGPDNEVASGEIYKAYEIWCEQENKHALKPKAFGAALRQCNLAPCKIHGNRGWRGVALK